jgi:hypothetical protein
MAQITTEIVAGSVAAVLAPNHDASTSIEKVARGGTCQFSCHDRDMKIVICEKANFGVRGGSARFEFQPDEMQKEQKVAKSWTAK